MNDYEVKHQVEEDLFYIPLPDTNRAFIKYRYLNSLADGGQVDFYSTFVPEDYRDKGLAAKLVKTAFAWADEQKLSIKASCWYADKILKKRASAAESNAE
jgi:predicted GNAT family acetyltransferase